MKAKKPIIKTYTAAVVVTGTFTQIQTVEASSAAEAQRLFEKGKGQNEDSSFDWNTWEETGHQVISKIEEVRE